MRIAYITAGAAGMYCGSCLHDNTLAKALIKKGVDVTLIPTYTPIRTDEEDMSMKKVFFGGINVYLQQKFALFRYTPWFIDKLFENRRLLAWVSRLSASTDAKELGELTVSILMGEEGKQRKELEKLVSWLKQDFKPDLVQITNAMFVGTARTIKKALNVPVLCSLQGEDLFLDDLVDPYRTRSFEVLYERAAEIDGFVASSHYYGTYMADYLRVPASKIHTVPLGLDLSDHGQASPLDETEPFTVGYLARNCPEKGLHLLIEAFRILAEQAGDRPIKLKVAGYLSKKDEAYLETQKKNINAWGLNDQVDFIGEVNRQAKIDFFKNIHVFSMPAPYKEPKGISLLEAMANGVPVVQPDHGAFSETVNQTGGGLLVEPHNPQAIADALKTLMDDPKQRRSLGEMGKTTVHQNFSDATMAEKTLEVYRRYLK